jgi:hypothetical protein
MVLQIDAAEDETHQFARLSGFPVEFVRGVQTSQKSNLLLARQAFKAFIRVKLDGLVKLPIVSLEYTATPPVYSGKMNRYFFCHGVLPLR